jgi:Acyl-CoA carboxylase epsilon subunit
MSTDDAATEHAAAAPSRPVLRIVRGEPSAEELAVLTALVAAAGGGEAGEPAAPPVRGRWNDPAHAVRQSWSVGPGGWRAAR